MLGRLMLAGAALTLTAATEPWRWTLPTGVQAPHVPADNLMSAAKVELGRRLRVEIDVPAGFAL